LIVATKSSKMSDFSMNLNLYEASIWTRVRKRIMIGAGWNRRVMINLYQRRKVKVKWQCEIILEKELNGYAIASIVTVDN
jgi:hypothetical protein